LSTIYLNILLRGSSMIENDGSLEAIGKRLKVLRALSGLNRGSFSAVTGVSKTSISYWEHGRGNLMQQQSAEKILKALAARGLKCTLAWLMTGSGGAPQALHRSPRKTTLHAFNIDIDTLKFGHEIYSFLSTQDPDRTIILQVKNNALVPIAEKNDILGGIFYPANKVNLAREKICIVKINDALDIRRVRKGTSANKFHLSYLSYDERCHLPFEMADVELEEIAPVIRLWR